MENKEFDSVASAFIGGYTLRRFFGSLYLRVERVAPSPSEFAAPFRPPRESLIEQIAKMRQKGIEVS